LNTVISQILFKLKSFGQVMSNYRWGNRVRFFEISAVLDTVCQVATVVIENAQLVLNQFKTC